MKLLKGVAMFIGKGLSTVLSLLLVGVSLLGGAGLFMGQQAQDAGILQQDTTELELIEALVDAQREQEIAAAQIAALQANAEAQIVRETGRADVNLTNARTDAYVRKLYADARVDLATNGIKARRSWRTFFQTLMIVCGTFGSAGFAYGWSQQQPEDEDQIQAKAA